ncbi:MAG: TonB-dependent receptor [Gammaproteobacteria bacterium]
MIVSDRVRSAHDTLKGVAAASLSTAAFLAAQAGFAQQVEESASDRSAGAGPMETVVVTATRIATDVQDVPIAITAVTADTLAQMQLNTLSELGNIVPNAMFRKSQGIYGAGVQVTMRGIGQTDTQFSGEPAVAYYIDDVYYPFLFGSNFDLLDLSHVEVLRGPQGTLLGRNSISGAVNLVSRKPSLDEASAYLDMTVGSFDRRDIRAGFSLPLTQTFAMSASMVSKSREGYMDVLDFSCEMYRRGTPELAGTFPFQTANTAWGTGREPNDCVIGHYGGEDSRAFRTALRWVPNDRIELNISFDQTDSNDDVAAEKVFETDYASTYGLQPDGTVNEAAANQNFITAFDQFSIPGTPFRWDERFETGSIYSTYDNFCDPFPVGTFIPGNTYYNGSLFRGGNCYGTKVPLKNEGFQGKLVIGVTDAIEATLVYGHREIDTFFGAAWDGTVLNDSLIFHEDHMKYENAELRFTGVHPRFDWVAGLFYYDGVADENGRPQNVRLGTQQYQNVYYYPSAKAAFANITFRVTDTISLNYGIRRSKDEKFVDYAAQHDATPPGSTTFVPAGTSTYFTLPIENERTDWKFGVDYRLSESGMVYASAATGYRLPGFTTRLFQVGQHEPQSPTALTNYEVGGKVDFLDGRLRLNAALFWLRYDQRPASFGGQEPRLAPDGVTVLPGNMTLIPDGPDGTPFENAFTNCRPYDPAIDGPPDIARGIGISCITRTFNYGVKGGEPIRGIEFELTARPTYNLTINTSVGYTDRGNATGRPVGFPDWTASGGIQYLFQLPIGTITPRLDWFYNSEIAYSTDLTQYDDPARSTFNARVTYWNSQHEYEVALGVTNLTDKEWYRQKTIFTTIGAPANIGQPAPPREWYLNVNKRF